MSDSEDEASPQLKLEVSDPPLPESPAETSVVVSKHLSPILSISVGFGN